MNHVIVSLFNSKYGLVFNETNLVIIIFITSTDIHSTANNAHFKGADSYIFEYHPSYLRYTLHIYIIIYRSSSNLKSLTWTWTKILCAYALLCRYYIIIKLSYVEIVLLNKLRSNT